MSASSSGLPARLARSRPRSQASQALGCPGAGAAKAAPEASRPAITSAAAHTVVFSARLLWSSSARASGAASAAPQAWGARAASCRMLRTWRMRNWPPFMTAGRLDMRGHSWKRLSVTQMDFTTASSRLMDIMPRERCASPPASAAVSATWLCARLVSSSDAYAGAATASATALVIASPSGESAPKAPRDDTWKLAAARASCRRGRIWPVSRLRKCASRRPASPGSRTGSRKSRKVLTTRL
mmetsp:Transcript_14089/g.35537  ORF Transcript_14089/g.35537 Transcript_14089/m.35537 type:complete len:241 (-) Transcript_14089:711-1433(-)